jgi:hypothetical protein
MHSGSSTNWVKAVFAGEVKWLFFLSWILLGVITTSVYDALTTWLGKSYAALATIIALSGVILFGTFILLGRILPRRLARQGQVQVEEDKAATAHRALVVLVGPGAGRPHISAVSFQRDTAPGARLERCWYLQTPEARQEGLELQARFADVNPTPIPVSSDHDLTQAYAGTLEAIDQALRAQLAPMLTKEDVIVDITGGTKPMTAGATLACMERGVALQYMYSLRNEKGELIKDHQGNAQSVAMKVELVQRGDGATPQDAPADVGGVSAPSGPATT